MVDFNQTELVRVGQREFVDHGYFIIQKDVFHISKQDCYADDIIRFKINHSQYIATIDNRSIKKFLFINWRKETQQIAIDLI